MTDILLSTGELLSDLDVVYDNSTYIETSDGRRIYTAHIVWRREAAASDPTAEPAPEPVPEPAPEPAPEPVPEPTLVRRELGSNVPQLDYWTPAAPVTDLMKQAGQWVSCTRSTFAWNDRRAVQLTADGYPAALLDDQMLATVVYQYQPQWTELYVQYNPGATVTYSGAVVQTRVRDGVDRLTGLGTQLIVRVTGLTAPMTRLTVTPTLEPAAPWDSRFLQRMSTFGTIRTMDWSRVNYTTPPPISGSPRTWTGGMPYLQQIELANRLQKDLWLCVHHLYTEAQIAELARLVESYLNPKSRIFVESSNEVWNSIFPQAQYARANGPTQDFNGQLRWHAERTETVARIFRDNVDGVETVLGSQAYNTWVTTFLLDQMTVLPDYVAIAPYFGNEIQSATSVDDIFDQMRSASLPRAYEAMQAQQDVVNGVLRELIAYEGGQHLAPQGAARNNTEFVDMCVQANRDPRMGDLYREYLARWNEITVGSLFVHYTDLDLYGRYGSFGSIEHPDILETPKRLALVDYAEGR